MTKPHIHLLDSKNVNMKTYIKSRKNPVNFNYNNLRRWIYLNLPKYVMVFENRYDHTIINVNKALALLDQYFIKPNFISDEDFSDATYTILYAFANIWYKISTSSLSKIEKTAKWREFVLNNPPSFEEIYKDQHKDIQNFWIIWWNKIDQPQRKNPTDFITLNKLVKDIGIELPIGLPQRLREAFYLGQYLTVRRAFKLQKTVTGRAKLLYLHLKYKSRILNAAHKYSGVQNMWYWEQENRKELPSRAFEEGIYYGLYLEATWSKETLAEEIYIHERDQKEPGYIFKKYI